MSASAHSPHAQRSSTSAERDPTHELDHEALAPKLQSPGHGDEARSTLHCTSLYAARAALAASSEPLGAPSPSASRWGPGDAALVERRARHVSRAERLRERFFGKLLKEQSPTAVTQRAGLPSSPRRPAPTRRDRGHGDSLYEPGDAILVERRAGHATLSERHAMRRHGKLQSSTI